MTRHAETDDPGLARVVASSGLPNHHVVDCRGLWWRRGYWSSGYPECVSIRVQRDGNSVDHFRGDRSTLVVSGDWVLVDAESMRRGQESGSRSVVLVLTASLELKPPPRGAAPELLAALLAAELALLGKPHDGQVARGVWSVCVSHHLTTLEAVAALGMKGVLGWSRFGVGLRMDILRRAIADAGLDLTNWPKDGLPETPRAGQWKRTLRSADLAIERAREGGPIKELRSVRRALLALLSKLPEDDDK